MVNPPPVPRLWPGQTVTLIATGPSLKSDDVDYVHGKSRSIIINDNYRLAPWADILYACDAAWWNTHHGCPQFLGQRWTQDDNAKAQLAVIERYGLQYVKGIDAAGLSTDPSLIHYGGNSGYQALNLALHFGAKRILLLGYDMGRGKDGKRHWFGNHPRHLAQTPDSMYQQWQRNFAAAAIDLQELEIEVINCSRETALTCFPRANIRDVL